MAPKPIPLQWRLWDKVLVGDECWEFQGARVFGYGKLNRGPRGAGMIRAHVAAYMLWHHLSEIPAGFQINHHCDNRACCRPDHLYLGTKSDNAFDAYARGQLVNANSRKTHCKRGHPFDDENTYRFGDRGQYRMCKTCNRQATRDRNRTKAERRTKGFSC